MPSLKLCMNSCINLSACTHLQRVHHPGTATTPTPPTPLRASIFHGALSVMKHVREWDGGGNYRENQAGSGRRTRAVKHPLSFFFSFCFVLFVCDTCRASRREDVLNMEKAFTFFLHHQFQAPSLGQRGQFNPQESI